MSTLVSSNEQPRARTVSRVFHDVPTKADLDAVEEQLATVRKNRNSLAVVVVLLVGMLIAAIGGLAWTFQQQGSQVTDAVAEVGDFRVLTEERAEVIAALGVAPAPEAGRLDEAVEAKVEATGKQIEDLTEERDTLLSPSCAASRSSTTRSTRAASRPRTSRPRSISCSRSRSAPRFPRRSTSPPTRKASRPGRKTSRRASRPT
jgi:uncharacterized protein HemX